ncbi:MAG TPA: hypothetical protein VGH54_22545 [Mycobacterium sp.]|uniref:hypothetical protein n=1 Tax=Mycobacterium sp. TaxID=1785 RepID=UPI002F3F6DB3
MSTVTAWGWFWLTWVFVGGGVEVYWLAVNTANTLSRQVWGAEKLDFAHPLDFAEWTPLHVALSVVLVCFFLWLCVHFPFGYLR